jgi:cytochrome P450
MADNPFSPAARANPYPVYQRLRERDPAHFNPYAGIWFLTSHRNCSAMLRDPRFSAARAQEGRQRAERLPPSMLNSDSPEHERLRDPFVALFTSRAISQLRPRIQAIAEELVQSIADQGRMEVISDFASPLAAGVLAAKLGVPSVDRARFHEWTQQTGIMLDPLAPPAAQQQVAPALAALRQYLAQLIAEHPSARPDDSPHPLLASAGTPNAITQEEVVSALMLFIVGGYEPLVHLIGNGILALLHNPTELQRWRENPALAKSAVEELLRYESPIQFTARIAREEVELDGQKIQDGQTVIAFLGAANRDPAVFSNPDRLDLGRTPNPHLGLGAGPHFCLGAPLVRLGGEIALATLVNHFPQIRLTTDTPRWRDSTIPHGLHALALTL